MKKSFINGVVVGAGIAVVLISLQHVRPFTPDGNAFVERLTFKACPLYMLGFMNGLKSVALVDILTILGNAIIYGMVGAILGMFFRKT